MPKFELHVTVPADREAALRDINWPSDVRVRVLAFENEMGYDVPPVRDVMTSCVIDADDLEAAQRRCSQFYAYVVRAREIPVLRQKIEVPATRSGGMPVQYFETHLRVVGDGHSGAVKVLRSRSHDGERYWTLRTRPEGQLCGHRLTLDMAVGNMVRTGSVPTGRIETEAVVWDTCPEHDAAWERASYG